MLARRWASSVLFTIATISVSTATGQTSVGSGTVVVIPTAANISVYSTEVFVRNPNANSITLNVRDLSTGIYFLLIHSGNDNSMIRLNAGE